MCLHTDPHEGTVFVNTIVYVQESIAIVLHRDNDDKFTFYRVIFE